MTAPTRRPGRFLGWQVAALATITATITGPGQTIGVSVFVDPMIETLGLTRSEASAAYLIGTLIGAALLLPVGRWIDQIGASRAMGWIGLAFGVGLLVMSGVQGFVTLVLGFTLIRWLGQGSLSLVSTLSITPWFDRRRGFVFGVSTTTTVALMSLSPIVLGLAIEAWDWRTAWVLAALAVWLVVIPIARFGIIDRPSDVGQYPDGAEAPTTEESLAASKGSSTRHEALRESRFWLMNLALAAVSLIGTALNFHQISILTAQGLTATEAAAMFLPQIAGAIVAGVLIGILADRIAARFLVAALMLLLALSLLLVAFLAPGWLVFAYAIGLGAAAGGFFPLIATVLPRWYGLAHIGSIQGVSVLVGVAASAAGPVSLALVADLAGGYSEAAWVFVWIPLSIAVATLAIHEPERAPLVP